MPRWDFVCENCASKFEWVCPFDKRMDVKCPHCGSYAIVKPPTGTSFVVNGFNAANGYGGQAKE